MCTLVEANLAAFRIWPAATHAIATLVPVESPGLGTMAVDKHWRLYYDPEYLRAKSPVDAAAVIIHETSHCMFRHHQRAVAQCGKNATPEDWHLWNVATDYAINSSLRAEGINVADGIFPGDAVPPLEDLLSAESYFSELRKRRQECTQDPASLGKPGSGSCSDGQQRPWESGSPGNSQDAPGAGGADGAEADGAGVPSEGTIEDIITKVAKAIASQKGRGKGRGELERFASTTLVPIADPKAAFMRAIRNALHAVAGPDHRTYSRSSRRRPAGEVVFPSTYTVIPDVCVLVDTSGSMNDQDLSMALALISRVFSAFRDRRGVEVICGDTSLKEVQRVFQCNQVSLTGGGGTNMGKLVKKIANRQRPPQLLIVATDGDTGWCDRSDVPTKVPVLVGLTNDYYKRRVPTWMSCFSLNP